MSYAHNVRSKRKRREREGFQLKTTEFGVSFNESILHFKTEQQAYAAFRNRNHMDEGWVPKLPGIDKRAA